MIKEEPLNSQCEADLVIVEEFKDNQKVLTGARKTLPSARYYHPESQMLNSRTINRRDVSSHPRVPLIQVLNALNRGLFPVSAESNSTNTIVSGKTVAISEIKRDSTNSDEQINSQASCRSTDKEISSMSSLSQSKVNSSENERKFLTKRPSDREDLPNTDSIKVSAKKFCEFDCLAYAASNGKSKNQNISSISASPCKSNPAEMEKYAIKTTLKRKMLVVKAVLTEAGSVPLQNTSNLRHETLPKLSDTRETSHNNQSATRPVVMTSKTVRFIDKENINPQTPAQSINVPNFNRPTKIRCSSEITENDPQTSVKGPFTKYFVPIVPSLNTYEKKTVKNLSSTKPEADKFKHKVSFVPTPVRNMQEIRPVYCVLPPAYNYEFNNGSVPLNYYPVSSQYRMMGTATRSSDMSIMGEQKLPSAQLQEQQRMKNDIGNCGAYYENFSGFPVQPAILRQNYAYASHLPNTSKSNKTPTCAGNMNVQFQTRTANIISGQDETKKSAMLDVSDNNYNSSQSDQLTKKKTVTLYKRITNEEDKNNQETSATIKGKNQVQDANAKLMKISELLQDMNKTLSDSFECPGLESSLPIWKMELEQCIQSVEKIRNVISEYQDKNK